MMTIWVRICLCICALFPMLVSGCAIQAAQAQPVEVNTAVPISYQIVLGKSLHDQEVINFLVSNHCSAAAQFELCQEAGMSLWMDGTNLIRTVYLYSGDANGVQRYRGKLPYALTFYDPMWLVQEKLSALDKEGLSKKAGLPDETNVPDHIHYWAAYKQLGLVVIYDSPVADPDAYIYAVMVNQ